MKKTLLTGIAALFLATGTAYANDFEVRICDGFLNRNHDTYRIPNCTDPYHEDPYYTLDFEALSYRDKKWLLDVCSNGGHCRVQVIVNKDNEGLDLYSAWSLQHVTTKPLFSWEPCDLHGCKGDNPPPPKCTGKYDACMRYYQ